MNIFRFCFALAILTPCFGASLPSSSPRPVIGYDGALPSVVFGASELKTALIRHGGGSAELSVDQSLRATAAVRFIIAVGSDASAVATTLKLTPAKYTTPQSYALRTSKTGTQTTHVVLAADAYGAMCGAMDLAEHVRLGTLSSLTNTDHQPYIASRGFKFNIPLDLRNPSYSDSSTAAQANIPEVWSMDFWHSYLDEMARNRYNVLSLWNLHPYPSLVKVPEFPDVALQDVLRTRVPIVENGKSGWDMFLPEVQMKDVEIVRTMSIEQKIEFWRAVMQYAKYRGIDVYLFTWNIFTFGATGKYGITDKQDNPATIAYYRASVREAILTYPLLAGIGISPAEHMDDKLKGDDSKEMWLWKVYGEGIRDALKQQPGRSIRFIHRMNQGKYEDVIAAWKNYDSGPFDYSYKYAIAHMYASTKPPFADTLLKEMPKGSRMWFTLRNDDVYSFRWGNPAFAREFIKNMPGPDQLAGFYMGPDGFTWGREAMDLEPTTPRQLILQKQWYSFMLWGRLSYDPTLPDALFQRTLAVHFPEVPIEELNSAWVAASEVLPEITRFHWQAIDTKWFPEACLSSRNFKGFFTVRDFAEANCMPGEKNINIRQWLRAQLANTSSKEITPPQVAGNLRNQASRALQGVAKLRPLQGDNKELRLTLGDIEAFGHLGNYYAAKIDAACNLALYDATSKPEYQQAAIGHLSTALEHWKRYAVTYTRQYKQPLLFNRVGWVDIPGTITNQVAADIEIARTWKPASLPPLSESP